MPLPSYDWAIEPQGLGPNVMTARILCSDTQTVLVARVLNNSTQDKTLSANSFLSMAEPVLCLSETDCDPASMSTDDNNPFCVSQLFKEPYCLPHPARHQTPCLLMGQSAWLLRSPPRPLMLRHPAHPYLPQKANWTTLRVCCTVCPKILPSIKSTVPRNFVRLESVNFLILGLASVRFARFRLG